MRIKDPRPAFKLFNVEPHDHQHCEHATKLYVGDQLLHGHEVGLAWIQFETRVAVPFADIVEMRVTVSRFVIEPCGVRGSLYNIDDEPRKAAGPCLDSDFGCQKRRGRDAGAG